MIKRFLIGFTVLISIFLFTNKVSALVYHHVDELNAFNEPITEDKLYTTFNVDKETYPYFFLYHSRAQEFDSETSSFKSYFYILFLKKDKIDVISSGYTNLYFSGTKAYYFEVKNMPDLTYSSLSNVMDYSSRTSTSLYTFLYYLSNVDLLFRNTNTVAIPANNKSKDPAIDTVNKVITIPIDYFYNDGNWQNYYLYFASPSINNMNYSLTFSYDYDLSGKPNLPVELIINDKVENVLQHMADITNSKYTAENGFGGGFSLDAGNFGGGGGGGRFDDDETNSCMSTQPFTYNGSFPNENIYGLVALSLNSCADLTGKTPDDFSSKSIKISYDARIIDLSTDPSGPSSDAIGDMLEDIRNEYELEEQEEIKFEIFQPVLKLINDKLPIINQFSQILNQFNFNEEINEPPVFKVNIPYFNLNDIEVFNFQFFIPYRDYVLGLECFFLAWFTAVRTYKIVKGYFGGGNNE